MISLVGDHLAPHRGTIGIQWRRCYGRGLFYVSEGHPGSSAPLGSHKPDYSPIQRYEQLVDKQAHDLDLTEKEASNIKDLIAEIKSKI